MFSPPEMIRFFLRSWTKKWPSASRDADVAGVVPAVAQRLRGRCGVAPIFEEHVRAAHGDLAGRAGRHLAARVIDDLRLADEARQAGRARARAGRRDSRGVDRDRAGLGRAVDLQHRHAAALRRRRPAAAAPASSRSSARAGWREIGRRPRRDARCTAWMVAGTSTVSVGRSRAIAASVASGAKRGVQRDGRAELQRRRGLDVEPADMEQRQHGQHVIVGGQSVHVLAHHARSRTAPPGAAPRPSAVPSCRRCRRSAAATRDRHAALRPSPVAACEQIGSSDAASGGAKSRPTTRASGSASRSGPIVAANASLDERAPSPTRRSG